MAQSMPGGIPVAMLVSVLLRVGALTAIACWSQAKRVFELNNSFIGSVKHICDFLGLYQDLSLGLYQDFSLGLYQD